jgi:hypothetical protein
MEDMEWLDDADTDEPAEFVEIFGFDEDSTEEETAPVLVKNDVVEKEQPVVEKEQVVVKHEEEAIVPKKKSKVFGPNTHKRG